MEWCDGSAVVLLSRRAVDDGPTMCCVCEDQLKSVLSVERDLDAAGGKTKEQKTFINNSLILLNFSKIIRYFYLNFSKKVEQKEPFKVNKVAKNTNKYLF